MEAKKIKDTDIGDSIFFGSYEQDGNTENGKEKIEWQVLAKENNKVLVISKKALDCQPYNSTDSDTTWETCSLREWLNTSFFNDAFSSLEQAMISETNVSADKNLEYDTDSGNATKDKIFLLSIDQASAYFSSDESRKCVVSDYAKKINAYIVDEYSIGFKSVCNWWLRTPGKNFQLSSFVHYDGSIISDGDFVSDKHLCVRPALWIITEF